MTTLHDETIQGLKDTLLWRRDALNKMLNTIAPFDAAKAKELLPTLNAIDAAIAARDGKASKRKIVQISNSDIDVVALCNDGTLWAVSNTGWICYNPIPQHPIP